MRTGPQTAVNIRNRKQLNMRLNKHLRLSPQVPSAPGVLIRIGKSPYAWPRPKSAEHALSGQRLAGLYFAGQDLAGTPNPGHSRILAGTGPGAHVIRISEPSGQAVEAARHINV